MKSKERFVLASEDLVVDTERRLMWKRTDTMNDLKRWVNYPDSADYARELREDKFAGFDDWRLPTKEEMGSLYDESLTNKDRFEKDVHISELFAPGGGISMIAGMVSGRFRTWVMSTRDGSFEHPDGLWTLSDSARAVRTMRDDETI